MAAPKKAAPKAATPKVDGTISAADRAIKSIYNDLSLQLRGTFNSQKLNYGEGVNRLNSTYDRLRNDLTDAGTGAQKGVIDQLHMLGLDAATPDALAGTQQEITASLMNAANRRAEEVGGLKAQGQQEQAAALHGIDNSRHEEAQVRADTLTYLSTELLKFKAAETTARGQVELASIEGQARLAEMKFQAAQAAAAARASSRGGGGDPLEALKAEKLGMEIGLLQQKYDNGGVAPGAGKSSGRKYTKGRGGLNAFLNSGSDYWTKGAGVNTRAAIERAIRSGSYRSGLTANTITHNDDPYSWATKYARGHITNPRINRDAVDLALQIYYGKS